MGEDALGREKVVLKLHGGLAAEFELLEREAVEPLRPLELLLPRVVELGLGCVGLLAVDGGAVPSMELVFNEDDPTLNFEAFDMALELEGVADALVGQALVITITSPCELE